MLCLLPRIKEYPKDTFPSGLSKHFFYVNMLLSDLGHTARLQVLNHYLESPPDCVPLWTLFAAVADSLDLFVPNILLKKFIPQRGCLVGDLSRAVVDPCGGCLSPAALYGVSIAPLFKLHAGEVSPGADKGSIQSHPSLEARSVERFPLGQRSNFRTPRCVRTTLSVRKSS